LLSGPSSTGEGTALITMDLDLINMEVQTKFDGLGGSITGAAIHGRTSVSQTGTAPAAIPLPQFPTNISSGMDEELIDLQPDAAYTEEFVNQSGGTTGQALNALVSGLVQGRMYLNLNSSTHPAGEIGGFFSIWPDSNEDGTINTPDFNE